MRAFMLGFTGALAIAVGLQTATAAPSPVRGAALASTPTVLPVAHHHCGQGQRWVPAGYAKKGKYRAGHCAPA